VLLSRKKQIMQERKLNLTEKMILLLTIVMLVIGYVLFFVNIPAFNHYVVEDGPVEWLTVFGLLLGVIVCIARFFKLFRKRTWWFLTVTFLIGLGLFFVAGEEISWGMRILGIHPSEFFEKNNAQHETNFHNLIVDGVKVNKLVFSLLLSIALGIYLVIVPIVYQKNQAVKNFFDRSAVPIPRLYQVISFIALFIVVELLPHEKKAELLECGTGLLFFLIVRFPKNEFIFRGSKQIH
jgi:cytochrome bd-type quinol oxidase subunit 2